MTQSHYITFQNVNSISMHTCTFRLMRNLDITVKTPKNMVKTFVWVLSIHWQAHALTSTTLSLREAFKKHAPAAICMSVKGFMIALSPTSSSQIKSNLLSRRSDTRNIWLPSRVSCHAWFSSENRLSSMENFFKGFLAQIFAALSMAGINWFTLTHSSPPHDAHQAHPKATKQPFSGLTSLPRQLSGEPKNFREPTPQEYDEHESESQAEGICWKYMIWGAHLRDLACSLVGADWNSTSVRDFISEEL